MLKHDGAERDNYAGFITPEIWRKALAGLALSAAFTTSAKARVNENVPPSGQAQPELTKKIDQQAPILAAEILRDYHRLGHKNKQRRIAGASPVFGRIARNELVLEYYTHSNITGREGQYIITADFTRKHKHIQPNDIQEILIRQPLKIIRPPIWPKLGIPNPDTYRFDITKADRAPLQQNSSGLHWNLYVEYFTGSRENLNDFNYYVSGGGTTGPYTATFGQPLNPQFYSVSFQQAQGVLHRIEMHAPINKEQNLTQQP